MRVSATPGGGRTRAWTVVALFAVIPALTAPISGPDALTAGQPRDGVVVGTVDLRVAAGDPPPMLSPYARPRYRPPVRPEPASVSAEGVVVYLTGPSVDPRPNPAPVRIIQRDRAIIPRVTPVQVGTLVEFPNVDDVFHNLFSLSGPHRFNLGRYPPGDSRSERFEQPGVVRLFCDIHSEMGGVILVLETPYFTRPDAQGRFRLAGVPAGAYTAVFWHEAAGVDSTQVVVRDGAETSVDFVLGR